MIDRAALATDFLCAAGWGDAARSALAGDASARSYERLIRPNQTAILMNAPPGQGDDPADFVKIGRYLSAQGLSVPEILATDLGQGFLLLEDFGDGLFASILHTHPSRQNALYALATDALIHLARAPLPADIPNLSAPDWANAAVFALTYYAAPLIGPPDPAPLLAAMTAALQTYADGPRIFSHRDFHAENLILLPDRQGLRQAGILDFQLGQGGQPGYDLVSLLQDARRDVQPQIESAMVARYATALGCDAAGFQASYAILGTQRALRIIGVFARLAQQGKARYLPMIPRVWGQLQRNLHHPALTDLRYACAVLPPPCAETLACLAKA